MVLLTCEVVAYVRRQALVQAPAQIQLRRSPNLLWGLRGAERQGGGAVRGAQLVRGPLQWAAWAGDRKVSAAAFFSPASTKLARCALHKPGKRLLIATVQPPVAALNIGQPKAQLA